MDIDFDSESSKRDSIIEMIRDTFGEDKVLNIITFKTETSKSAILTACRGLNIPLEEAQQLADLIPIVRGKAYTIKECLEGGEEKEAVPTFVKLINSYTGLLEMVQKIEGLIGGISSHASGLYLFNDNYVTQNSFMRTPKGLPITCWEMNDSDIAGALKVDLLTVANLDIIHETLNLLLKNKEIEWQGNLRATYDKYISPDVLDYETPEMFEILGTPKGNNIFQLSTDMGLKACQMVKPKSVTQMGLVNSLMRLQSDGGDETPLEKYQRFTQDINEWYAEMCSCGLNQQEIKVLEKHLLKNNGICAEQEDLMEISMDKEVSGFTMAESNTIRKAIAKKKADLIKESKDLFYSKGLSLGTRKEMLDYVWDKQFSLSLGYAFSKCHTIPYSCIGLQQLNLLYHYPTIYSQCAALLVNSSSNEGNDSNSIDYGKVAISVSQAKNEGVVFVPAYINKAEKGFSPDKEKNLIMIGLKGISGINNEVADLIIEGRPYESFEDFVNRIKLTKVQMISLIKAGAFDEFNPKRREIMVAYLNKCATEEVSLKNKLDGRDLQKAIDMNVLPEKYFIYNRYYNFNKYITSPQFIYKKENRKTYLVAQNIGLIFFEQHYVPELSEGTDYKYCKEGIIFNKSSYNKVYKERMNKILEFMNTPEFIENFNCALYSKYQAETWGKYCLGTDKEWEFDSYNYYISGHALENVNTDKYNISKFCDLSAQPSIEEEFEYKGKTCYKYSISRLCGVVIDTDRTKHSVTLLTHDNEVIKLKYYAGQFINYNSKITAEENGKKIIKDDSWFKRGTLLLVTGYRIDDIFKPKTYRDSVYRHSTALITDYTKEGGLAIRELRYGEKENIWANQK